MICNCSSGLARAKCQNIGSCVQRGAVVYCCSLQRICTVNVRMKTVEFLLYTLKPGSGNDFHRIMKEQSAPCHRAAGMDIVSFGNSVDDNDAYYLIRAYDDLAHLNALL